MKVYDNNGTLKYEKEPLTKEEALISVPSVDLNYYSVVYKSPNNNGWEIGVNKFSRTALASERLLNIVTGNRLVGVGNGLGAKTVMNEVMVEKAKMIICLMTDQQINDDYIINEARVSRDYSGGGLSYSEAANKLANPHDMFFEAVRAEIRASGIVEYLEAMQLEQEAAGILFAPEAYLRIEDYLTSKQKDDSNYAQEEEFENTAETIDALASGKANSDGSTNFPQIILNEVQITDWNDVGGGSGNAEFNTEVDGEKLQTIDGNVIFNSSTPPSKFYSLVENSKLLNLLKEYVPGTPEGDLAKDTIYLEEIDSIGGVFHNNIPTISRAVDNTLTPDFNLVNEGQLILLNDNLSLQINNNSTQIAIIKSAIGVRLLEQSKTFSNALVTVSAGTFGFDLSSGNNWSVPITEDIFEPVDSGRSFTIGGNTLNFYGWTLKSGSTIDLTASIEFNGKLWFEFGNVVNNTSVDVKIIQYTSLNDFQNGINGNEKNITNLIITNSNDNKTIDYVFTSLLKATDGLYIEPQITTSNNLPVALKGLDDGYDSFFKLITSSETASIGLEDIKIQSTSTRPKLENKNQLQINEIFDLEIGNLFLFVAEKVDKEDSGINFTGRFEYLLDGTPWMTVRNNGDTDIILASLTPFEMYREIGNDASTIGIDRDNGDVELIKEQSGYGGVKLLINQNAAFILRIDNAGNIVDDYEATVDNNIVVKRQIDKIVDGTTDFSEITLNGDSITTWPSRTKSRVKIGESINITDVDSWDTPLTQNWENYDIIELVMEINKNNEGITIPMKMTVEIPTNTINTNRAMVWAHDSTSIGKSGVAHFYASNNVSFSWKAIENISSTGTNKLNLFQVYGVKF